MATTVKHTDIHQNLIDLCRENDRSAQIKIYELYYKAMYNTSYRIVNDSQEAEDIMQESFLDAFRKLDSYRGESTFGSWLKRIVVNKSLDTIKKKKLFTTELNEELEVPEDNQEAEIEFTLNRLNQTHIALEQMPGQYRIILSLYLLEGYDHQEISEILNISYNNVRVRYLRAKKKLIEKITNTDKQYLQTLKN